MILRKPLARCKSMLPTIIGLVLGLGTDLKKPTGNFLVFSGSQFTDCMDSVINWQFCMAHLDFNILSSIYCILSNLNSYTGNVSTIFSRI